MLISVVGPGEPVSTERLLDEGGRADLWAQTARARPAGSTRTWIALLEVVGDAEEMDIQPPQSDPVQEGQGFALRSGKAPLRP